MDTYQAVLEQFQKGQLILAIDLTRAAERPHKLPPSAWTEFDATDCLEKSWSEKMCQTRVGLPFRYVSDQ